MQSGLVSTLLKVMICSRTLPIKDKSLTDAHRPSHQMLEPQKAPDTQPGVLGQGNGTLDGEGEILFSLIHQFHLQEW
jgi:hypothetical protein